MPASLASDYVQTLDRREKRRITRLFFSEHKGEDRDEVCRLWVEELRRVGIDMDKPRIEAQLRRG